MSDPSSNPAQAAAPDSHGNSPAAWTGVVIIAVAAVVAGLAVVFTAWILFGIAAVLGPIIGCLVWKLMAANERKQGHPAAQ
jgi:hypothetical protein